MNASGGPPGQGGKEEKKKDLEEISKMIFKNALARRLVEIIMRDGLLTSVFDWYEDLHRVHKILSDQDSRLRSVLSGAKDCTCFTWNLGPETKVHLGEGEFDREPGSGVSGPDEPAG